MGSLVQALQLRYSTESIAPTVHDKKRSNTVGKGLGGSMGTYRRGTEDG